MRPWRTKRLATWASMAFPRSVPRCHLITKAARIGCPSLAKMTSQWRYMSREEREAMGTVLSIPTRSQTKTGSGMKHLEDSRTEWCRINFQNGPQAMHPRSEEPILAKWTSIKIWKHTQSLSMSSCKHRLNLSKVTSCWGTKSLRSRLQRKLTRWHLCMARRVMTLESWLLEG